MHKLALAATLTAVAAGGTIAIVTATRTTDAEASASHTSTAVPTPAARAVPATAPGAPLRMHHAAESVPSLPALLGQRRPRVMPAAAVDCIAVGHHLAELQGQIGTNDDSARYAKAFSEICEREAWTLERRGCVIATDDLMNAHLCAFSQPQGSAQDADVPAALQCSAVATHLAPIIQSAGIHADVPDLAPQIEDACEAGGWSTDLRQCFVNAPAIENLRACLHGD